MTTRSPRLALAPGARINDGNYEVGPILGQGGFAITYFGYQGSRRLPVAIKEFFPAGCVRENGRVVPGGSWDSTSLEAARESFLREGRTLERFNHPGIVRVFGIFEENGAAYLAAEFLDGENLAQGLVRNGPMHQQQALEVARQVGDSLQFVHAGGLIHSDVKPENVISTEGNRLVLIDFGVSQGYLTHKSNKDAMRGASPGYSPPEQYQKGKALTPASDVYALAATVYTLLAGAAPPDANARSKGKLVPSLLERNPTVSTACARAIEAGLEMDPRKRPPTVKAFLELLGCIEEGQPPRGPTTSTGSLRVGLHCELRGHTGWVLSLALHPDGKQLVSASKDGTVRLWSWPDGHPLGTMVAHKDQVTGASISPDGKFLVTSSHNGEIKLWDMLKGIELQTLKQKAPPVHSVAFFPSGQAVAAGIGNGQAHVYVQGNPTPLVLEGHGAPVSCVAVSPDGLWLATSSNDCMVHLWETPVVAGKFRFVRGLTGHTRIVQSVSFSNDSKLLITSSNDLSVRVWEANTGLELRKLLGHKAMVWNASFTSNPDLVVSASGDKRLHFFSLDSGREVHQFEAHDAWVRALVSDRTRPLVASAGGDAVIRIWDFV